MSKLGIEFSSAASCWHWEHQTHTHTHTHTHTRCDHCKDHHPRPVMRAKSHKMLIKFKCLHELSLLSRTHTCNLIGLGILSIKSRLCCHQRQLHAHTFQNGNEIRTICQNNPIQESADPHSVWLLGWMIWERVFNLSEPRFLHLYNGALSTMLTVSL